MLSKDQLNNRNYETKLSSIKSLGEQSELADFDLVSGSGSFGTILEKSGFSAVPSSRKTSPGNDRYFSGGYITRTYGSFNSGQVDAIQIETPVELSFESGDEIRDKYFKSIGESIVEYVTLHYKKKDNVKSTK